MTRGLPKFDDLLAMAEQDPQALERLRSELVENLIAGAQDEILKQRLRGLQFRIDLERERSTSPLSACVRLSQMMHESLLDLRDSLQAPQSLKNRRRATTAIVIELENRQKKR